MFDSRDIQGHVLNWKQRTFGVAMAADAHECAMRQLEESLELAQALGVNAVEAMRLTSTVFTKPSGNIYQEFGGATTTLLACAQSCGIILSEAALAELTRIEGLPAEKFRKRARRNAELGIGEDPDHYQCSKMNMKSGLEE